MFSSNSISLASNNSNLNFQDSNSNLLSTTDYSNNQSTDQSRDNPSCCIVIGCKNAYPNSSIKYYQVPSIESDFIENNTSRQWYINTLREDLLDYILISMKTGKAIKETHYVCIEHFDEESFAISVDHNDLEDQMVLKEDAVPSLFEIEVFQKMIAHQEQIANNQQQKQNQQILNRPTQPQQNGTANYQVLSNLILNSNKQQHQQQQPETNSVENHTLTKVLSQNSPTIQRETNKRVRMDPDTRAALIQRVPKAVKRTSCVLPFIPLPPTTTTTTPAASIRSPISNGKVQKAVKHTMPQQLLKRRPTELDNNTTSGQSILKQQQKSISKQANNSANTYLKDILPPPIMQSTKRPASAQAHTVNKAVKHTGGGSHAYYQSLNPGSTLPKVKPFAPLNVNSLNEQSFGKSNQVAANKASMTTTYVYKRVLQQPDIDLNLECEEEDLVYIMPPVTPPPVKVPVLEKTGASVTELMSTSGANTELDNKGVAKSDVKVTSPPNSSKKHNKPPAKKLEEAKDTTENSNNSTSEAVRAIMENTFYKKELQYNNKQPLAKIAKKNTPQITPVTSASKATSSNRTNVVITSPALQAALENESNARGSSSESERSDSDGGDESHKRVVSTPLKPAVQVGNSPVAKPNSYANVLGKFYSRQNSSIVVALESAAGEFEASVSSSLSKLSGKRGKQVAQNAELPADLRVGNYPAKCNICNIILDNNIELTSHICSHLESGENDANGMSTYISPFDAVTTTCGVCDTTFDQPFDLIKHLDQKHMKQLGEYKCRICELQHSKLGELVAHLNHTHSNEEMPYRCDACGFRTSFYADAIYHIKKEHKSTLRHFCPYCLKSLSLPFSEKLGYVQCQLFYAHLTTHFNKHENDTLQPSKCKHCQKCILHVRYMKEHLVNDHMPIVPGLNTTKISNRDV